MVRAPCCSKVGLHKGPWTAREDKLLVNYIRVHGEGRWRSLPMKAGLLRCGKSCRLRWLNYLRPDIKRGNITPDEDDLIIRLHSLLGNRWSLIAGRLPGRTDNEIKNYWNSHLSKRINKNSDKKKCFSTEPRKTTTTTTTSKSNKHSTISKNKNKGSQDCANGNTIKTKIHLPKAVRVSSVSVAKTSTSVNSTGSGSSCNHAAIGDSTGVQYLACSYLSGFELANINYNASETLPCNEDNDHDLANGHVSSSQNYMLRSDNIMLDEMFEEYEQLLKNDNFAQFGSYIDSLLA